MEDSAESVPCCRRPFPYRIMEGLPVIPPELPVSIHGTAVATVLDFPVEEPERRV
jgi:hypothetical protein